MITTLVDNIRMELFGPSGSFEHDEHCKVNVGIKIVFEALIAF